MLKDYVHKIVLLEVPQLVQEFTNV